MTKEQLQKYIDKGFDEKRFNKLFSIQLLLIRAAEYYNLEAIELTQKSGLYTLNNKKAFNNLDKQINKVAKTISPAVSNSDENVLNMMEDFDDFIKILNEFIDR